MGVTKEQLRDVSCDLQLSGTHAQLFVFWRAFWLVTVTRVDLSRNLEREMDLLELSLWGDVRRRGLVFKHLNVGEQERLNNEAKESESSL